MEEVLSSIKTIKQLNGEKHEENTLKKISKEATMKIS